MRVLCPYLPQLLDLRTWASVRIDAPAAEFVNVRGDDLAYCTALRGRWGGGSLALVEHDIEIHADVIPTFRRCSRPWCLFPYEHGERGRWLDRGLGCTRFSAHLQRMVPFDWIMAQPAPVPGSWRHLDGQIAAACERRGFNRHVHRPGVIHRNRHLDVA